MSEPARSVTMAKSDLLTDNLLSNDHGELLDVIDQLRSAGVSRYIALPQVIVCGDQSSGKSSVLEAISGARFPTKDNLCTLFATELILRRHSTVELKVSIDAGPDRPETEREKLSAFSMPTQNLSQFADIIENAKTAMGLGVKGKTFSNDILKIEILGPSQPNLTLVDLPGLFHAGSKHQSSEDRDVVMKLVRGYMKQPRSIVLAVVSASNDYHNQIVTEMAQKFDRHGDRTMGVITKPDTLSPTSDTERAFVSLAKNEEVQFRLGWHVLRNRKFENRDCTLLQRNEMKAQFFSSGIWKTLPSKLVGIETLKPRLSAVLRDQILKELPGLIVDVRKEIDECSSHLSKLGESRATMREQRLYLSRISQRFSTLVNAALNGTYADEFFGDACSEMGQKKRLRAVVQYQLSEFSEEIAKKGHSREIVDDNTVLGDDHSPPLVWRSQYMKEVREVIEKSRGKELAGTFNPTIIGDLFSQQAQPWEEIATFWAEEILESVRVTLILILDQTSDENTKRAILTEIINPHLDKCSRLLAARLKLILNSHKIGHPITYNGAFTETIDGMQRKRSNDTYLAAFEAANSGNDHLNMAQIASVLENVTARQGKYMDQWACHQAVDCMQAYYKVAMKTFIDNFAVLVIENVLLDSLSSLFSPLEVIELDDAVVTLVAGESKVSQTERVQDEVKLEKLKRGAHILRRLDRYRTVRWSFHRQMREPPIRRQNAARLERNSLILHGELAYLKDYQDGLIQLRAVLRIQRR